MAEAFLPMRKSVEILGGDMKPGTVRALITDSLKCMKHKPDWQLRKQAADTIVALAASSQVPYALSSALHREVGVPSALAWDPISFPKHSFSSI